MQQTSAFENAMQQLDKSVAELRIKNQELRDKVERLRAPEKIIEVCLPVKMDPSTIRRAHGGEPGRTTSSGQVRIKVFTGYRVQYSNALGPYKGGIRFHPNVSLDEVKALSFWMSVKCSVAGIPMGGGKGGVIVNPKLLSDKEMERLSRAYSRAIAADIGPYVDVPAPDVNTNPQIMAWMVDEYARIKNQEPRIKGGRKKLSGLELLATFTGKPLNKGGSKGRTEATARGGLYVLQALLQKIKYQKSKIKNTDQISKMRTVAIQGMGNVGGIFGRLASEAGFTVVAISDSRGGVYNPEGLDIKVAELWKQQKGRIDDFPGAGNKQITNEQLLELPVDILVPAALENVITGENAGKIKAKVILELANGPVTVEADKILNKNKVLLVPDFLANSGGVTVSYFEWYQNLHNLHWSEKQVNLKLKEKMEKAFAKVWRAHDQYHIELRTAAYVVALNRILKAMK